MEAQTPPRHVRVISCVWTLEELEAFNMRYVELLLACQAPEGTVISAEDIRQAGVGRAARRPDHQISTKRGSPGCWIAPGHLQALCLPKKASC